MNKQDVDQCLEYSDAKNHVIQGVKYRDRDKARALFEDLTVEIRHVGETVGFPFESKEEQAKGGLHFAYSVVIRRKDGRKTPAFKFYGSTADHEKGIPPSAYDILACVSSDFFAEDNFIEFCSGYGYDSDSRRALKIFKGVMVQLAKLKHVFNDEEAGYLPR